MARRAYAVAPPPFVGDGSILVVRPFHGLTNSDAFFAFSDTGVRFGQVWTGTGAGGRWRLTRLSPPSIALIGRSPIEPALQLMLRTI